jgi:hypothetical protein
MSGGALELREIPSCLAAGSSGKWYWTPAAPFCFHAAEIRPEPGGELSDALRLDAIERADSELRAERYRDDAPSRGLCLDEPVRVYPGQAIGIALTNRAADEARFVLVLYVEPCGVEGKPDHEL